MAAEQLQFHCSYRYATGGFDLQAEFQAGPGVTALVGESGSGKSTILSMIAGIVRPQSGRITLHDRVLTDTNHGIHLAPEARHVAIVFQDHCLFPHLSVKRNLEYGHRRRPPREIDFDQLVEILELKDLLNRYPQTLSGGQQQRVALGRAILRGPQLLMLDEPLTGLDDELKDRILSYLQKAIEMWHIPILFVSHDMRDVQRLADRIVTLRRGRVQGVMEAH